MKALNLVGNKYGKLLVLKRLENSKDGKTKWLCKCECGNEVVVTGNNLRSGGSKSCGCSKEIPYNFKDLTNSIFGRLKVLSRAGKRDTRVKWACICECGSLLVVCSKELLNGDTKSCGCLQSEKVI